MTDTPDDLGDSRLAEQVALGVEALNQLGIPNTLADAIETLQRQLSEARAAEPKRPLHECGYCMTWRSSPCGEGCYWQLPPAINWKQRAEDLERQLSEARAEVEICHARETCCCGDYMRGHSAFSEHSPKSMYDRALELADERAETAERQLSASRAEGERMRAALEFYADPGKRTKDVPDFYSELDFGETARAALSPPSRS